MINFTDSISNPYNWFVQSLSLIQSLITFSLNESVRFHWFSVTNFSRFQSVKFDWELVKFHWFSFREYKRNRQPSKPAKFRGRQSPGEIFIFITILWERLKNCVDLTGKSLFLLISWRKYNSRLLNIEID